MNQQLYNMFPVQPEKVLVPMQRFTELSLKNTEKLFALQLKVVQSYVHLGVEQLKTLFQVKDAESLRAFVDSRADVAKNLGEKIVADTKAVADLGAKFKAETQKLTRESLKVAASGSA